MDSVMDFVNISSIYHATQKRQPPHYQTIKILKRGNVRDVRDKKGKTWFWQNKFSGRKRMDLFYSI